jgi:cellulose biosynthesis protein BcsQ
MFWSPRDGSGVTTNMLITGIMLAWKERKKVALINAEIKNHDLEIYLIPINAKNSNILENTGIDVLTRSVLLNNLDINSIKNAAQSFYSDNLQIISGTLKTDMGDYRYDMMSPLVKIIEEMEKGYDHIFVSAPNGFNEVAENLKLVVDRVIVNLPQNKHEIEHYFKKYHTVMKEKDLFFMVGNYDKDSKYNLRNLERLYKPLKNKITAIPYNTDLKDAISESSVIQYLQKNIDVEGENQSFINEVQRVSNLIIKRGGEIEDESGVDS